MGAFALINMINQMMMMIHVMRVPQHAGKPFNLSQHVEEETKADTGHDINMCHLHLQTKKYH